MKKDEYTKKINSLFEQNYDNFLENNINTDIVLQLNLNLVNSDMNKDDIMRIIDEKFDDVIKKQEHLLEVLGIGPQLKAHKNRGDIISYMDLLVILCNNVFSYFNMEI